MSESLNKKDIEKLLPHREPMLLIDELINIKKLSSAGTNVLIKPRKLGPGGTDVLEKPRYIVPGKPNLLENHFDREISILELQTWVYP